MTPADQLEHDARTIIRRLETAWLPGRPLDAHRVMDALWPHGWPEQHGLGDWWRTPLGLACAAQLTEDRATITQAQAADALGVTAGTVATLVNVRGTLERAPGGGVVRGAVLARLVRLRATGAPQTGD